MWNSTFEPGLRGPLRWLTEQNRLRPLNPLTHQARWKTKTMPSESDAFLNQKPNKQTSHWITLRSLLIAAVFPFVYPVEKTVKNITSWQVCLLPSLARVYSLPPRHPSVSARMALWQLNNYSIPDCWIWDSYSQLGATRLVGYLPPYI